MDFPQQLSTALKDGSNNTSVNQARNRVCEDVEKFLSAPPQFGNSEADNIQDGALDAMMESSALIFKGLVQSVQQNIDVTENVNIEDDPVKAALDAKQIYVVHKDQLDREVLSFYIRAGKNLLRWYIQIFLSQNAPSLPSPVKRLQNTGIIELLVCFLENQIESMDSTNQDMERDISLYLFYATFSAFPGDETSEVALRYLILDLSFTKTVLKFLVKPCTPALLVALVRNVHTALVSLQGAEEEVLSSEISFIELPSEVATWVSKDASEVTFCSICIHILQWALNSEPTFPGQEDDRRFDLVLEILGAFYALRIGQKLDGSEANKRLFQCILDILRLPEESEKDIIQCKTSVVSLLMDSNPVVSKDLVSNGCFVSLLELMDKQVQRIIEDVKVDDGAAAAIVPVLLVLNKFSTAHMDMRKTVKEYVFPQDAEQTFRQKVEEHESTSKKRNMGPLDAPKGTLRWNLISLLTWPQGHIKRCTGELLWTLCSFDATEFVHRVGFGNGMPLLGAKGLVKMPQQ